MIRYSIAFYVICATALINGLLSSAKVLAETHKQVNAAGHLFVMALTLRVVGLAILFLLVGRGPIKKAAMRVMIWGYLAGICTASVSCYCLFDYTVIVEDQVALFSNNFFPLWRILFLGLVTGLALLCLKFICSLFGVLNVEKDGLNSTRQP